LQLLNIYIVIMSDPWYCQQLHTHDVKDRVSQLCISTTNQRSSKLFIQVASFH